MDEKFLDGPSVGYCSSSDEEADEANTFVESPQIQSSTSTDPRTGPKGVLADYERHKRKHKIDTIVQEKKLIKTINKFSLENPINKKLEKESDLDELERIRQRRLEQMKNIAKGRILEVSDRFEFLHLIEQQPHDCLLFMHIYADGNEKSEQLNDALLELAGRFGQQTTHGKTTAKFHKVQAKVLRTSNKFAEDALPALQIYQAEQLIGNFIRLSTELGEDYVVDDLVIFLRRSGIPLPYGIGE